MTDQTDEKTDEAEDKKKPLQMRPGRLELKKTVDAGQVRQSFSHGRSKSVAVEVRRKRTFTPGAAGGLTEVKKRAATEAVEAEPAAPPPVRSLRSRQRGRTRQLPQHLGASSPALRPQRSNQHVQFLSHSERIP